MHEIREFIQALVPNDQSTAEIARMLLRLVLAAILGGIIGIERELSNKPAGLRTNMFICFGAAMFTIISDQLAARFGGDHTRIAAQIIPGIGFIGAGSILHSRGSVTGLTTAATLFVGASIGMAAGGGLYLFAIFATLVIFLALHILGRVEARYNLKAVTLTYDVVGERSDLVISTIADALAQRHQAMLSMQLSPAESGARVQFTVEARKNEHFEIVQVLRRSRNVNRVETFGATEQE